MQLLKKHFLTFETRWGGGGIFFLIIGSNIWDHTERGWGKAYKLLTTAKRIKVSGCLISILNCADKVPLWKVFWSFTRLSVINLPSNEKIWEINYWRHATCQCLEIKLDEDISNGHFGYLVNYVRVTAVDWTLKLGE